MRHALRPGQWPVLLCLLALSGLAWLALWRLGETMPAMGMAGMVMEAPMAMPWRPADFLLAWAMWAVMMAGMMLPSALPMILLYQLVAGQRQSRREAAWQVLLFAAAYLLVWSGFSIAATLLQWWLDQSSLLTASLAIASPWLGGGILLLAGVYQWLPLKETCLGHCRSPLNFLFSHWHAGASGALRMGMAHGLYCLGCCWAVMGLLFVVGVMNLLWVALLSAFVLLEKLVPFGRWGSRLIGGVLMAWGVAIWLR
ncbi:DUF2182 domain-containing protein [Pseudogulbenkiania sp. MAI-1]|uniref:DUF2182 domain-containing protein n=1 Tax=Pseudogulbenkiania sp. MAI-1 TaxID=990370 RepID=UPI0004A3EF63|nr:DUF2182 domain-containing protein [Pseudogulbenkiania sp. MAI-1]